MLDIDTALALFAAAVTCAGGIVWLVRLEGRMNMADKEIEDAKDTAKAFNCFKDDIHSRVSEEIKPLRESLSKIEVNMAKFSARLGLLLANRNISGDDSTQL